MNHFHLPTVLKTILNGLAMQYEGELLSTEDKKANLQRVLAEIEHEKQSSPRPANHTPVTTPELALHAK
jgi:hypothetical protein